MSELKRFFSERKNTLVLMAYVSLLVLGLMDNIRGPFYPDILQTLSLNSTLGSLFFAVASFAALVGNFLGSFLLNRFSAHGLMNFSILGLGFGFWLIARSFDFYSMLIYCSVFGLHFGMLNVSQNVVVQKNADVRFRRRIFNGLHAMYGLAALLAPLLANGLLDLGWSWSQSFAMVGFFSLLLGACFLVFGWRWGTTTQVNVIHQDEPSFHLPSALLLSGALAFYIMGELSLSTRLPLWVRESFALSPQEANSYMALFCASLFVSRLIFTFVSFSRFSNLSILSVSAVLSCLIYSLGLIFHPALASLAGFFMGPFFPVIMDEMSHSFGDKAPKVIGWSITFGSVMIVIMHFVLGVLTDLYGINQALWIGPFALIISFLALSLVSLRRAKS